jgi:transposase
MLTKEEDVEIHALSTRGWSVSAISRHTGADRKTVRKYLTRPGQERKARPSCLEPYRGYIEARFADDPHLEATVLHRELRGAGFERSYPTLVRELRRLELRPVCLVCQHRRGRAPTTEIEHPPGEEVQWDWLELHETPWGEPAFLLVGALSHSSRFRGAFCEAMTFGHLADAVHRVLAALGGTPRTWRTDRMATVIVPGTDRLTSEAAELVKHYGAKLVPCPPRRAQRKGVVEAAIKYLTRSWWRSAAVGSLAAAQRSLDDFCCQVADARTRAGGTVGELGTREPLKALPPLPYPAMIRVGRKVSRSALVAFEGNRYSVPPACAGRQVVVSARVGGGGLQIATRAGEILAKHRRALPGSGQTVRSAAHALALERAVLAAFTTGRDCARKINRPPGQDALDELARLRGLGKEQRAVVVSLADYAALAEMAR